MTYQKTYFVEKHYEIENDGKSPEWISSQGDLDLDFLSLPYLIDEESGIKMTDPYATATYLATAYDKELLGFTLQEKAIVDMRQNESKSKGKSLLI